MEQPVIRNVSILLKVDWTDYIFLSCHLLILNARRVSYRFFDNVVDILISIIYPNPNPMKRNNQCTVKPPSSRTQSAPTMLSKTW